MKIKRQSAVKLMEDSVPRPLGKSYVGLAARVKGWGESGGKVFCLLLNRGLALVLFGHCAAPNHQQTNKQREQDWLHPPIQTPPWVRVKGSNRARVNGPLPHLHP